jgi:endonuclease YncB( thermonuclease family)
MKSNLNLISFISLMSFLSFSNLAYAGQNCDHSLDKFKCLEFVKISDGDTAVFNVPNTHPLLGQKVKISLADVKVPTGSVKSKCAKDIRKKSKKVSRDLLKKARYIEVTDARKYRSGVIGKIKFDGKDLSKHLVNSKLAIAEKKYKGANWCSL